MSTKIMGILNVTPDSFSDGGRYDTVENALNHARAMITDGADIIDIGAESTRPGATSLTADDEISRLLPVLRAIKAEFKIPVSIDTYHAKTADAALKEGADIINDIWGLQYAAEPEEMAKTVAKYNAIIICMHNQNSTDYDCDIIDSIHQFFCRSIKIALNAGIPRENIILDSGIGFGKTAEQCLDVINRLGELNNIDSFTYPQLLGVSQKSFIGKSLGLDVHERLEATGAACLWGISRGVKILRVHDVKEISRMVKMWETIQNRRNTP